MMRAWGPMLSTVLLDQLDLNESGVARLDDVAQLQAHALGRTPAPCRARDERLAFEDRDRAGDIGCHGTAGGGERRPQQKDPPQHALTSTARTPAQERARVVTHNLGGAFIECQSC